MAEVATERVSGRVVRLKIPERFVTEAGQYKELSEMCRLEAASVEAEARMLLVTSYP